MTTLSSHRHRPETTPRTSQPGFTRLKWPSTLQSHPSPPAPPHPRPHGTQPPAGRPSVNETGPQPFPPPLSTPFPPSPPEARPLVIKTPIDYATHPPSAVPSQPLSLSCLRLACGPCLLLSAARPAGLPVPQARSRRKHARYGAGLSSAINPFTASPCLL